VAGSGKMGGAVKWYTTVVLPQLRLLEHGRLSPPARQLWSWRLSLGVYAPGQGRCKGKDAVARGDWAHGQRWRRGSSLWPTEPLVAWLWGQRGLFFLGVSPGGHTCVQRLGVRVGLAVRPSHQARTRARSARTRQRGRCAHAGVEEEKVCGEKDKGE
jgi:hypothetical protein